MINNKKILIVDDEKRIRILVTDFLKREGFQVVEAEDGEQALDLFYGDKDIALIILDVMMPKLDGWEVCKEIRKEADIPIIMLTAKGEETNELHGFHIGADEYIAKPFSPSILVVRVKALLKRIYTDDIIRIGKLKIDIPAHQVYIQDAQLELSPTEYDLLMYFLNNPSTALSREQILNNVWGYDYYGSYRTVDTHINRLRIKLGVDCDYIKTVRGYGYKFEVSL